VRNDIGVPFWLSAAERRAAVSVGLLERASDGSSPESLDAFDVYAITAPAARPDPCKELEGKMRPPAAR
jgi:hypothetical protein